MQSKPAKNPFLTITADEREKLLPFINYRDTARLTVSVMGEKDTLRKTYVLNRGVYDAPGVEVQPSGIPAVMKYDTAQYPRNRLGLAAWTIDKNNPLTARVFVNQLWQEFFGRGIVKTTGDFGMQGELPSHPWLLDWLAVDFVEHGWDIKRLVKQMVTSATYRQSSKFVPEKTKSDPENIYLSRSPRIRMNAEMVRDVVLASSGLLKPIIGGPSVKPYQPPGLWEMATSGRGILATYKQDHGDLLYRRGMYTFIKRTVPPVGMMIFDASNRDQCEINRPRTNTPLQALIMMNDPTVLESSKALADDIIQQKLSQEGAVTNAFVRIINRHPEKNELDILLQYLKDQEVYFKSHPADLEKIIKVGEYKSKTAPVPALAATMQMVQVIYNMEEAITKT
jgi:hypothetical protein